MSVIRPRSLKSTTVTGIIVLGIIYLVAGPPRRAHKAYQTLDIDRISGTKELIVKRSHQPQQVEYNSKQDSERHRTHGGLPAVADDIKERGEFEKERKKLKLKDAGVEIMPLDKIDAVRDEEADEVVEIKPDSPKVSTEQVKESLGQGQRDSNKEKENSPKQNGAPESENTPEPKIGEKHLSEGVQVNRQGIAGTNQTADTQIKERSESQVIAEEKEPKQKFDNPQKEKSQVQGVMTEVTSAIRNIIKGDTTNHTNDTVNVNSNQAQPLVKETPLPHIVNPHDFKYIINNESVCSPGHLSIHHLIYFHSSPHSAMDRMSLRRGWAQNDLFPNLPSRVVFFMGRPREEALIKDVMSEAIRHGDIIMEDYMDTYNNMTHKAVGAMKWINAYCSNAKFVLKADQDVYVNLFEIVKRLLAMSPTSRFFLCGVYVNNSMPILRDPENCFKWCVPKHIFPGRRAYPTYCAGAAYVFTSNLAAGLYNSSLYTPYFYIDDVFITGLLPQKLPQIEHIGFPDGALLVGGKGLRETMHKPNATYKILAVHDPSTRNPSYYWRDHLEHLGPDQVNMLGKENYKTILEKAKILENDCKSGKVK